LWEFMRVSLQEEEKFSSAPLYRGAITELSRG
jgi:hypothetical protein